MDIRGYKTREKDKKKASKLVVADQTTSRL